MKLITFAIPSYNSEGYMRKCIESLLVGGDDVEIIIVNDGSKDKTGEIADEYAANYPTICKAVHQENGGHGEGVNQGIRHGTGLYYKVVDSDDWVDGDVLKQILETIKKHREENALPDLYVTNFVYDHVEDNTKFTREFRKNLPTDRLFGWKDVRKFRFGSVLMMHSLMYKMSVLRECGLELPKHTFYVDNIFSYVPLPYVKTAYYLPVDLYHYFIGRNDQSVNMDVFSKRYDQQNRVMKIMAEAYDVRKLKEIDKRLFKYMAYDLSCLMMVTLTFTLAKPSNMAKDEVKKLMKTKKAALKQLWADIKAHDKWIYRKMRYRSYPAIYTFLPPPFDRIAVIQGYKAMAKRVKLG